MSRERGFATVRGRVGLPPLLQRPPLPIRARLGVWGWLMLWVVRPSWLWRRELAAVALLTGLGAAGSASAGWRAGAAGPLGVSVLLGVVPYTRRRVLVVWRRARLRRHWDRAMRFAGLATSNDRIPRVRRVRDVPAGEALAVRVPRGATVDELEGQTERVAAVLRVREVRVARDSDRADRAEVAVVRRDPFAGALGGELPWPWVLAERVRLWEPIPVGVDDLGDVVWLRLVGKNVLLGGEPGAGKSAALSVLLAAAALDPWVKIWGLDAKRLELGLWRPVLDQVVFGNLDHAIDLLRALVAIMDERYAALEAAGRRMLTPADGPLYVVPIDELRFYTAGADRKARAMFNDLIIDVTARGRAAGIIALPATQKPSTDVVPSSLRDLLAYRWAMRCTTRDASDTILGAGWATLGWSAAEIDPETRGVGLLLAEGGQPRRVKSYYLTDSDIRAIAARGAALRAAHSD